MSYMLIKFFGILKLTVSFSFNDIRYLSLIELIMLMVTQMEVDNE